MLIIKHLHRGVKVNADKPLVEPQIIPLIIFNE